MKITKDTLIGTMLDNDPEVAEVLMLCGMHCITCPSAMMETLEQACMVHGIPVEDVLEALDDYNQEKLERGF